MKMWQPKKTDINKEWETIRNTIKLSASECIGNLIKRQNKKRFDEECADIVKKKKGSKNEFAPRTK